MTHSLVSTQQVIARIVSDFDIPEAAYDLPTVLDWIGDAIEHIGVFLEYSEKAVTAEVENFRWAIPCDLLEVSSVEYKGHPLVECSTTRTPSTQNTYPRDPVTTKSLFQTNAQSPASFTDSIKTYDEVSGNSGFCECYTMRNGYLNTSIEQGCLQVTASFILTDEDGFPMVPNYVEYRDALSYYVLRKLIMRGYKHPVIGYPEADRLWNNACAAAGNTALFPNIDRAETLRRAWVRLIPRIHPHGVFFEDI